MWSSTLSTVALALATTLLLGLDPTARAAPPPTPSSHPVDDLRAAYAKRVQGEVSRFWWWNLAALPGSTEFGTEAHTTKVVVALNRRGEVVDVEVTQASGLDQLDYCVIHAFYMTAVFTPPSAQLAAVNEIIRLPELTFFVPARRVKRDLYDEAASAAQRFRALVREQAEIHNAEPSGSTPAGR